MHLCQQPDPEKSRSGIVRCIRPFPGPAVEKGQEKRPGPFRVIAVPDPRSVVAQDSECRMLDLADARSGSRGPRDASAVRGRRIYSPPQRLELVQEKLARRERWFGDGVAHPSPRAAVHDQAALAEDAKNKKKEKRARQKQQKQKVEESEIAASATSATSADLTDAGNANGQVCVAFRGCCVNCDSWVINLACVVEQGEA